MKLIVGLGNPGEKYINTRHNAGFLFVDTLAEKLDLNWVLEKKTHAEIAKNSELVLAKPQTFMNKSGESVSKILSFYKIDAKDLIVVHDDVDIPFGEFRFKSGSGSAGHHGVVDIIEKIGTQDFWRFRIGVGRPSQDKFAVQDFVLNSFKKEEIEFIKSLSSQIAL